MGQRAVISSPNVIEFVVWEARNRRDRCCVELPLLYNN